MPGKKTKLARFGVSGRPPACIWPSSAGRHGVWGAEPAVGSTKGSERLQIGMRRKRQPCSGLALLLAQLPAQGQARLVTALEGKGDRRARPKMSRRLAVHRSIDAA